MVTFKEENRRVQAQRTVWPAGVKEWVKDLNGEVHRLDDQSGVNLIAW
jgi:hypothetical protein